MIIEQETISGSSILKMRFDHIIHTLVTDSDLAMKYFKLFVDHPYFQTVCAGAKHHHFIVGGLEQHVKEIIAFMIHQKDLYPTVYHNVSTTDIFAAAFLHDFDKIWAYRPITQEDRDRGLKFLEGQVFTYSDHEPSKILDGITQTLLLLADYGIRPTDKQWSAVTFAHGGYSSANFVYGGVSSVGNSVLHHNKLAVLMHMADLWSSQLLGGCLA